MFECSILGGDALQIGESGNVEVKFGFGICSPPNLALKFCVTFERLVLSRLRLLSPPSETQRADDEAESNQRLLKQPQNNLQK